MTQIIGAKNKLIPFRKMMVFVDGENMVFCYQKLLKNGRAPCKSVKHEKDVYVWNKNTIKNPGSHNIIRVYYYTYATGSDETIKRIRKDIKSLVYLKPSDDSLSPNNLYPIVFKKEKKEAATKGVDIQMSVDILSQIYLDNIDTVYLIAGDGDYLPLISEVIRMGKQIYLSAFSEGLNPKLEVMVDQFNLLDDTYFCKTEGASGTYKLPHNSKSQ